MDIIRPRAANWFDRYEPIARYNLAESYVEPFSLRELFDLVGDADAHRDRLLDLPLDYGVTDGSDAFRDGVARLYKGMTRDNILITSGAINANHVVLYGLVRPGDKVVVAHPNYQQLYAVPRSFGADERPLELRKENHFMPDLHELRALAGDRCRLIVLTNPNNPTGALMERDTLEEIVKIARHTGAYVLVDEIYKHYPRPGVELPAIAELYEKGITTSSLSKVYGLSGLRLGWVCAAPEVIKSLYAYRNYTVISSGVLSDLAATVAFAHFDRLNARNTAIIEDNLAYLSDFLRARPWIECEIPRAGTFTLLKYNLPMTSTALCEKLMDKTKVFVMPGGCFDMDDCVRLGFGSRREIFRPGLDAFGAFLDEQKEAYGHGA